MVISLSILYLFLGGLTLAKILADCEIHGIQPNPIFALIIIAFWPIFWALFLLCNFKK
jgi:hypothetical protein